MSKKSVAAVPISAPAQYVPLIAMSIRPRCRAGIISSIAELIAAYSPPMPAPARTRVAYRNTTQPPPACVAAVRPLPIRYTPSVTMNRFLRPSLSDSRPKNSAPMTSPIRYQVAMSADWLADSAAWSSR